MAKHSSDSMIAALVMQLVSKYSNVAVHLVVTMVLSRMLTPEEFGTAAIVTVFTSFFSIIADVGISTAIIQYKDLAKRECDALFFLSVVVGIVLAAVFCLLSWPISLIYKDAELVRLCCVASLSVLFYSANMAPNGVLLRDRRFASVSVRLVFASIFSGVLAIALTSRGFGSYALVWQAVASAAVVLIWNWFASGLRLDNPHFMEPLKKVWRYSIFQAGFSTINYFARNLDNLLVGAFIGRAQLGQYDKAYKLMGYPLTYLTGVFSDVLQPFLSEYQADRRKLYEHWLSICRVLALAGMLVTAVFVCFPKEIVLVMYGDQWLHAVPVVATLGLSVGIQMVNSTSGAIFQSAGRTDALFKSGIVCTCVSLVAILAGVASRDIAILGLCVSIAYAMHFCVTAHLLVNKVLGMNALSFLRCFLPSSAAAVTSIMVSMGAASLTSNASWTVGLLLRSLACIASYSFVTWVTGEWKCLKAFREMKRLGS